MNPSTTPSTSISNLAVELQLKIARDLDQCSLARLSRVARAWTAPANDVLWSNMESLSPLLRLVPRQLVGDSYEPDTPVSGTTLATFDQYASRVRVLDWADSEWHNDDPEWLKIFAELSSLLHSTRPNRPLLPNLRSFRAYCQTSEGVDAIATWLSPSLETVDITLGLEVDDGASTLFLLGVWDHCAQLMSFSLRMDDRSSNPRRSTINVLLALLRSLRAAEQVTVPLYMALPQHLAALAGLPALEELTLFLVESSPSSGGLLSSSLLLGPSNPFLSPITTIPQLLEVGVGATASSNLSSSSTPTPNPTSIPRSIPFPCLRSLTITGSLSAIASIIRSTHPAHNLERLSLITDCIRNPYEMTRAMQDIVMCCPRLAILDVDIYMSAGDHEEAWVDWSPLVRAWGGGQGQGQSQRRLVVSIRHPDLAPAPDAFVLTLPTN